MCDKDRKGHEKKQPKTNKQKGQKEQKGERKPVIIESWGDFMRKILG